MSDVSPLTFEVLWQDFENGGHPPTLKSEEHAQALCPVCPKTLEFGRVPDGKVEVWCPSGCSPLLIADKLHHQANGFEDKAAPVDDDAPPALRIVGIEDFAAVDEPGARALVGEGSDDALIPAGADVMVYGDGGAGKTTLMVDLACHLAAGDDWLGMPVAEPARVLLIENEGPRAFFRRKLDRKVSGWKGSPLENRCRVLEEPWSKLNLQDERYRQALAEAIDVEQLDVIVAGPLVRLGMEDNGTLREVRDFAGRLTDVRARCGREVTLVIVHHESKTGKVSGTWEGAVDTMLHVQAQGNGHTRLYVQKARWATKRHLNTIHLAWTDGEGFEVAEEQEHSDNELIDKILESAKEHGGEGWNGVKEGIPGNADRLKRLRDQLLDGGRLVNLGTERRMKLWHADDEHQPEQL